jgi:two-component system KDP operon response regulator KdpE
MGAETARGTSGGRAAPHLAHPPLVLVAEGDPRHAGFIRDRLTRQGFLVIVARDGADALRLTEQERPSLVVLSVRLADRSGIDLMHQLHRRSSVPVILLSAHDERGYKVPALNLGADDFLVKPFSPEELAARIRAVLRRTKTGNQQEVIRLDGVEIDLTRHTVTRHGAPVRLTRTEWRLLEHLVANAGHVLLNRDLLDGVWGPEYVHDVQYLRVWISRLRRKLEQNPSNPQFIKTHAGIGYMLDATVMS